MPTILGISTNHDAGAALIENGRLIAAASEGRFNRRKHYGALPFESIEYCLNEGDISPENLDSVAIASEMLSNDTKALFDRNVDTSLLSDRSHSFISRLKYRLYEIVRPTKQIPNYLRDVEFPDPVPVSLVNHHEAHAASAYYTCGHSDALVVTLDGLGDRLSGSVWRGSDGDLEVQRRWDRSGSLGWFYGIVTQALGWWIGNGEGKTMGLASYTDPDPEVMSDLREYLPIYEDGELVDPYQFSDASSWSIHDTHHWTFEEATEIERLINVHGRESVAASAQSLLEEQVLEIVQSWIQSINAEHLAVAGGVFLNVQVNRRILEETELEDYFIFPAAGDSGLAAGAALRANRALDEGFQPFGLTNAYFGPSIEQDEPTVFEERHLSVEEPEDIVNACADRLADGEIVAWCQGRMEYGPRALGNRSILIDPTQDNSMERVNRRVKFRDSWRPFAPSILEEAVEEYLVDPVYDPFMITSTKVREEKRDEIPAVTHVDGTTRPQVVRKSVNEQYWRLIDAFSDRTGTPVLLNTSYNLSGDPIVCDVRDAIQSFYDTGLDALAVGDYLLSK